MLEVDKIVIEVFIWQVIIALVCSLFNTILENSYREVTQFIPMSNYWITALTWWLLMTYFVPISLMVTMEMVKLFQGSVPSKIDMATPASMSASLLPTTPRLTRTWDKSNLFSLTKRAPSPKIIWSSGISSAEDNSTAVQTSPINNSKDRLSEKQSTSEIPLLKKQNKIRKYSKLSE